MLTNSTPETAEAEEPPPGGEVSTSGEASAIAQAHVNGEASTSADTLPDNTELETRLYDEFGNGAPPSDALPSALAESDLDDVQHTDVAHQQPVTRTSPL